MGWEPWGTGWGAHIIAPLGPPQSHPRGTACLGAGFQFAHSPVLCALLPNSPCIGPELALTPALPRTSAGDLGQVSHAVWKKD